MGAILLSVTDEDNLVSKQLLKTFRHLPLACICPGAVALRRILGLGPFENMTGIAVVIHRVLGRDAIPTGEVNAYVKIDNMRGVPDQNLIRAVLDFDDAINPIDPVEGNAWPKLDTVEFRTGDYYIHMED